MLLRANTYYAVRNTECIPDGGTNYELRVTPYIFIFLKIGSGMCLMISMIHRHIQRV